MKLVICYLIVLVFLSGCSSSPERQLNSTSYDKSLLFIFYINADNSLVSSQSSSKVGPLGPRIYDQILTEMKKHSTWEAWIYFDPPAHASDKKSVIQRWKSGELKTLQSFSETNSASFEILKTLGDLISKESQGIARDTHFFYWGHGFSWPGTKSNDLSHPDTEASTPLFVSQLEKLKERLESASVLSSGQFSSLIFDACVMATLENLYEFDDLAKAYVVAPQLMPENGIDFSTLPLLADSTEAFAQANSLQEKKDSLVSRKFLSLKKPQVDPSLRDTLKIWADYLTLEREEALSQYRKFEKQLRMKGGGLIGVSIRDFILESSKALTEKGFLRRPLNTPIFSPEVRIDVPARIEIVTDETLLTKVRQLRISQELPLIEFYKALR